jgi:hypothetical protein
MNQNRSKAMMFGLYANALLLAGILVVLLNRPSGSVNPTAFGQTADQNPTAGGNGVFVMPGEVGPNSWGCYLLDVNHKTLCVYEYQPKDKQLVLTAARDFEYDVQLKNLNTDKPWYEIQKLIQTENAPPPVVPEQHGAISPDGVNDAAPMPK